MLIVVNFGRFFTWMYLAVVLDLYSRRVIGWAIAERMTAALVCDALMMALWRHHMLKDAIVHSDWGSQYCSAAYQRLISKTPIDLQYEQESRLL
jgi:putative transposase